jgi:hypothetical protein
MGSWLLVCAGMECHKVANTFVLYYMTVWHGTAIGRQFKRCFSPLVGLAIPCMARTSIFAKLLPSIFLRSHAIALVL